MFDWRKYLYPQRGGGTVSARTDKIFNALVLLVAGAILSFFVTREAACKTMYELTRTTADSLLVVQRCHSAGTGYE